MTMIRTYKRNIDRELFEAFREQALAEGNSSLIAEKIDPDQFPGQVWLAFEGDQLASVSAVEESHYTGNSDVGRICRYHILKKFRHGRYGFKMLPKQYEWAKQEGFKLLYWTHDVKAKALNDLYQKKRRFYSDTDYFFDDPVFSSFHLNDQYLFEVSPKSKMLQYIYQSEIEPDYQWVPRNRVVELAKCKL